MLDLLLMQESQTLQDLPSVELDSIFLQGSVLRQDVCQTCIQLFEVNAEELVKQLAAVKSDNVVVVEKFVLLDFVLEK